MKNITLSFEVLAAIIAVTILQAFASTSATAAAAATQCAKPTLTPPSVSGPVHSVTVTIATATTGAYLRYTLDGSTPTGGSSGHGTLIKAASGKVTFTFGPAGKTLKAITYKAGWVDSLIASGNYVYESGQ
jgi:Chitobiase/beta-hexosaminidase C-terminal domain